MTADATTTQSDRDFMMRESYHSMEIRTHFNTNRSGTSSLYRRWIGVTLSMFQISFIHVPRKVKFARRDMIQGCATRCIYGASFAPPSPIQEQLLIFAHGTCPRVGEQSRTQDTAANHCPICESPFVQPSQGSEWNADRRDMLPRTQPFCHPVWSSGMFAAAFCYIDIIASNESHQIFSWLQTRFTRSGMLCIIQGTVTYMRC